jgi:membrane peptidoglycan carboxypeptidase
MKGSDSAMPIWADFMREALNLHPELNGDWQMPETVRQAEIDTRSGSLIKELNSSEAETVKNEQAALKNNGNKNTDSAAQIETPAEADIYVTNVPAEFRRVEYFVSGTVPNKSFLPVKEPDAETEINPNAAPTPFVTWQEAQQNQGKTQIDANKQNDEEDLQQNLTVMMCPVTGMRATSNCPNMKPETFRKGSEPKEFCRFHINPPR